MFVRAICVAALLAWATLTGAAQTAASTASPAPRLYVGLGGSLLTREQFAGFQGNTIVPTFTAGVQLSPRLAVQAGVGYRWNTRRYTFAGRQLDESGQSQPGNWNSTRRDNYLTVPILARYTATRNLDRRLALDLLGGVTIRRYFEGFSEVFTFDQSQVTQPGVFDYDQARTTGYLSLGPGLRYRLGTHLDLTGDFLVDLTTVKSYGSTSGRVSGNALLGVRYRLGGH